MASASVAAWRAGGAVVGVPSGGGTGCEAEDRAQQLGAPPGVLERGVHHVHPGDEVVDGAALDQDPAVAELVAHVAHRRCWPGRPVGRGWRRRRAGGRRRRPGAGRGGAGRVVGGGQQLLELGLHLGEGLTGGRLEAHAGASGGDQPRRHLQGDGRGGQGEQRVEVGPDRLGAAQEGVEQAHQVRRRGECRRTECGEAASSGLVHLGFELGQLVEALLQRGVGGEERRQAGARWTMAGVKKKALKCSAERRSRVGMRAISPVTFTSAEASSDGRPIRMAPERSAASSR